MRKLVSENLNEYYRDYSDTMFGNYDLSYSGAEDANVEGQKNLDEMIPPPTIKLSPEEFESYISELLRFLPQNPILSIQIFNKVLRDHPYLSKRPIGYNRINPYLPVIQKFKKSVETFFNSAKVNMPKN